MLDKNRIKTFYKHMESGDFVRQMSAHATQTIVLADAAKFQTPGFVRILPFNQIDRLITDDALPADIEQALTQQNVKLEKVPTWRTSK